MPSERNGDGGPARRIWLRNSAAAAGAGPGRGAGKRRLAQRGVWDSVTPAKATGGLRVASLHFIALLTLAAFGDGAAALEVLLRAPNYVFVGDSAVLKCEHGVNTAQLHKVEWLKDGDHKLFQFVRGRNPPFRNFTTPGATLDWSRSNENEIRLTGLSLEANGVYSCEVSMETPIYTKPSNDERLVVIQRQSEDPVVRGVKESYFAGEKVAVNCTSSPTHPPVQIAWLVNGREVSDQLLTRFSDGSTRHYKLTTHHNRPFRTSSDDHLEDVYNYGSPESPKGKSANALGTMDNRLQGEKTQGSGKSDFLASAALGKLLHGNSPRTTTTRPASLRPGQGGLIVAAPTGASASQTLGARATVLTTDAASAASVATAGTPPADGDEDDEESNPMDVFDPPEVASILTASLSTTTVQLSFVLTDEVVRYLKKDSEESGDLDVDPTIPKVRLLLTCSAIIPETVDGRYADERRTTIAADVILSEETTARFSSASHSTHSPPRPWLLFLPLLASLFLLAATTQPAALHSQETATTLSLTMMREDSSLPQLPVFTCKACSANHVRPRR